MNDDYGHYGKGTTGYVHYTQAQKGGGSGIGCGSWAEIIGVAIILFWILGAIGSCAA